VNLARDTTVSLDYLLNLWNIVNELYVKKCKSAIVLIFLGESFFIDYMSERVL